MNEARREQRSTRRQSVGRGNGSPALRPRSMIRGGVAVADVELHQLLTGRGWVEIDRVDELTMYDWPPSAPDKEHEFTYLIIDLRSDPGAGPAYRVSVANGDRLMYEVEAELVADLDTIEASRCAGCTPCPHEAAG